MNVVFCSSDLYAKCVGVAIYSLLESNAKLEELNIYVLTTDMTREHQQMLVDMCKKFNRKVYVIEALDILEQAQKDLNLLDFKGGLNTYARAMANKFMPQEVKKALFLDADLIVTGSLKDLESLDMRDNIIAGVYEISVMIADLCYEDLTLLNQCPHYINYGVAYIDLENWRRFGGDEMIRRCVAEAKAPFRIAEQSILNLAFKEHTQIIPVKYNFYTVLHGVPYKSVCKWYRRKRVFEEKEYEEAMANPVIIHFIGDYFHRPWYENNICRYKSEYMRYYIASPWGNEPLDPEPDNISAVFRAYYRILIWLRKNRHDTVYFKLRYRWVQWLREHIPDMDKKIRRKAKE